MISKTTIAQARIGQVLKDDHTIGLELYIGSRIKTWRVYYRTRGDKTERRLKLGYYPTLTLKDARDLAREMLVEVAKGNDPAARTEGVTLERVYREFSDYTAGKRKPKTLEMYRALWTHVGPALGKRSVRSIKRADLAELHRGIGSYQANRMLAFVSRLYSFAESRDYIDAGYNPTRGIERNAERARTRVATAEELERIGDAINRWLRDDATSKRQFARLLNAIILNGTRLNEWAMAEKAWLDDAVTTLSLPDSKTGAKNIPVPALLQQTIKDAINESKGKLVFGTAYGDELATTSLWRSFKRDASLGDLRIHDLRRSYATYAFSDGVDINMISKLLGHSSIKTTESVYAHMLPDTRKQAGDKISTMMAEKITALRPAGA